MDLKAILEEQIKFLNEQIKCCYSPEGTHALATAQMEMIQMYRSLGF